MECFDDAWYKCRTGLDDVLHTRMTTPVGLRGVGWGWGWGVGNIFFFFLKTFSS